METRSKPRGETKASVSSSSSTSSSNDQFFALDDDLKDTNVYCKMSAEELNAKIADSIISALTKPEVATIIQQAVKESLLPFQKRVAELEANSVKDRAIITDLKQQVEEMRKEISTVKTSPGLKHQVEELKKEMSAVKTISVKNEIRSEQANSGKLNNVIINGFEESESEDLQEKINVFTNQIECQIGSFKARRIGKKLENRKSRLVLVELTSVWDKRKLMASRMSLREKGFPDMYFNEDLTKDQAGIFYQARQAKKTCPNIKSAWTENGVVLLRIEGRAQPIAVNNNEDIANITHSAEPTLIT